jgi:hypothetical protein
MEGEICEVSYIKGKFVKPCIKVWVENQEAICLKNKRLPPGSPLFFKLIGVIRVPEQALLQQLLQIHRYWHL